MNERHPLTCWECKAHITGHIINSIGRTLLVPCGHPITKAQRDTLDQEMTDAQNRK